MDMVQEETTSSQTKTKDEVFDEVDKARIDKVQNLREELIGLLTKDESGKTRIPGSTSDKVLLAALLDGTDRVVLTKARLKAASKENESLGNLAGAVAQALKSFNVSKARTSSLESRDLPGDFKLIDPVPGEMDIGLLPMTSSDLNS